jgi:hypothetical protein
MLLGIWTKIAFDYPNFRSSSDLALVGNASIFSDRLRLTPAQSSKIGAAWYQNKIPVQQGVEVVFSFQITSPGADGFAFVFQNEGTSAIGGDGCQIGYGN